MSFSSIHAVFGNSLRATSLAFSIFSINIPYPSVGSATHNQAKRVCKQSLQASERRLLRGGSLKDEQSATHQAATLAPQRSITCVTVPTSLPSWIIGLPDTSVVNKGQQLLTKIHKNTPRYYVSACFIFLIVYKLVCNFHSFIRVICPCNFHTNIFKCFLLLSHTPRCLHHVFI